MGAGTEKSDESIQNLLRISFDRNVSARGLGQDCDGTRCRTGFRLADIENKNTKGRYVNVTNHGTKQSIGHQVRDEGHKPKHVGLPTTSIPGRFHRHFLCLLTP